MTLNNLLAEIMAVLAWIFLIISYWKNKDDKLLVLQVISCIFFILNYIFLKAYTGLFVIILEIIRDLLYIWFKDDRKTFIYSLPVYGIIGITSYDGFWSLFSIFASLNDGYALIYKGRKVVSLGIITYILWLIYDLYCVSYANVIAEGFVILSNIIILILGRKKMDNKKFFLISK